MISDRILLKEYIRRLLWEKGMGTDFAEAEEKALKDYEAAQKEYDAWRKEVQKKQDFIAACVNKGVKPDSAEGKRIKSSDPTRYDYDPKVVAKSEAAMTGLLNKVKSKYAAFNPLATDFSAAGAPKKKETVDRDGVDPPKDKKVYLDVEKMVPFEMYHWNDKRWVRAVVKVPLGFGKEEGSHPGEDRLAVILGAERQGDSVSFDLKTKNGWRWEVKGLKGMSDQIRPGTLGVRAFEKAEKALVAVCRQMRSFVKEAKSIGIDKLLTTDEQQGMFRVIDAFVQDEVDSILGGEISTERFIAFRRAIKAGNRLKTQWSSELGDRGPERINIAGKDVDMARSQYVDLARRVAKHNPDTDLLNTIDSRERALDRLSSPAFDDPDKWLDDWNESIDLQKIFADVAGVFLVFEEGFLKIPRKFLERALKLKRVSQGVPRYSYEM